MALTLPFRNPASAASPGEKPPVVEVGDFSEEVEGEEGESEETQSSGDAELQ